MDHNSQGRRPPFRRGRRGPDRRPEQRHQPPPAEQAARGGDRVDVEQIMRDIRARIAQRSGVDLSVAQVTELAARRLEGILDPRTIKPGLLDQLRKGASAARQPEDSAAGQAPFVFDETSLYGSHRGSLRFIRRMLNPILKLFFNPVPLVQALQAQVAINADAAAREADRDRLQREWNALHYELLRRVVTEAARASIEVQNLAMRVESLTARVDFSDRRVRALEGTTPPPAQPRPPHRPAEVTVIVTPPPPVPVPAAVAAPAPAGEGRSITDGARTVGGAAAPDGARPDGQRRKRRRRRGRRGSGPLEGAVPGGPTDPGAADPTGGVDLDGDDDGAEDEPSASASTAVDPVDARPRDAVGSTLTTPADDAPARTRFDDGAVRSTPEDPAAPPRVQEEG